MQQKKIVLALTLALTAASSAHAQFAPWPNGAVEVSPIMGTAATPNSPYAVAIGQNAIAGTTYSNGNPTLLIAPVWPYENQVAIGSASVAWGHGDLAVGAGAVAVSQPPLGMNGASTALGYSATSWGLNSSAFGYRASAGAVVGTAPLASPTINNATAVGSLSSVQATGGTALGVGATVGAGATGSVALGAGSTTNRVNTVEIGGRTISGVGAAVSGTDAVNLNQLNAAIAGVGGVDTGVILNQANAYTDQAINAVRREYSRAIAAVAAAPMLPALAAGERAVAVGSSYYNGQQAIGIAYGQAINNSAMVNAGIASTGSKPVFRAGAAWKF